MAQLLSEKFYEKMKALEKKYPQKQALLLPALHAAQEEKGWLPPEVLDEIADFFQMHPAQVREVASFYTMFRLRPKGKYHLRLCTNVSCSLRGAEEVLRFCEKRLGIQVGETTPDQKFTLEEEECLGACGTAPAMMVNGKYYLENLTVEKIAQWLDEVEKE